MIRICRSRRDEAGVAFWSHTLDVTDILQDAGQSDEEDATVDVEIEGVMMKQDVKMVSRLYWRKPDIEALYIIADKAPGVEAGIFHRAGAPRIPRIRTDKVSHREPPRGLPRCFFREEYLSALMPYELEELELVDYNIDMYDFQNYNPNAENDDLQDMDTT
ncbi:hypothetical protein EV368DRAFT_37198 [Lentinula lateritia]|nr:hypothetical protein EV368DRAFT_37198 [Lentinula lateritia]